jgi:hypothetical protein
MKHDNFKIPDPWGRAKYYKQIWLESEDGGSERWVYVCRQGLAYIFIVIDDLPAAMGRDATSLFGAQVSVVDLATIGPETIASALRSCGYEEELDFKSEKDRFIIADMCRSYGAHAPLWNEDGGRVNIENKYGSYDEKHPAFRKLRSDARKFAEENLFHDEARNELLDTKIVNKIGETAREYMNGNEGHWAALRRIKDQGENATPEQKIILKMYQNVGQTLGAGPVPEDIIGKKS